VVWVAITTGLEMVGYANSLLESHISLFLVNNWVKNICIGCEIEKCIVDIENAHACEFVLCSISVVSVPRCFTQRDRTLVTSSEPFM
jgi:hypothetical protein